jgi:hypothetical protein
MTILKCLVKLDEKKVLVCVIIQKRERYTYLGLAPVYVSAQILLRKLPAFMVVEVSPARAAA